MGGEDLSQEQQLSYLSTLMSPLLQQIERNLPNIKEAAPQLSPSDQAKAGKLPVNMVLQVCNFFHADSSCLLSLPVSYVCCILGCCCLWESQVESAIDVTIQAQAPCPAFCLILATAECTDVVKQSIGMLSLQLL